MAVIKTVVTTEVEVDTDTFTPEQWKQFILEHVSAMEIKRLMESDMFGVEKLKLRAINNAQTRMIDLL